MSIRHLVAAALMASACAARADVIPTSTTAGGQPAFLSGWTTGNGTDVLSSGVLSGNVNLIGGVAYGSAASADALFSKASGSLGAAADATRLYYSKGIEGMYLLGAGHGVLAAMLGNGVSVIGSNGGVVVSQGTAAGLQTSGRSIDSAGGSTGASAGGSTGSSAGGSTDASAGGSTGGAGGSTGGASPGSAALRAEPAVSFPPIGQLDLPAPAAPTAAVAEPSTIALMLAGVLGAGSLTRRRNR